MLVVEDMVPDDDRKARYLDTISSSYLELTQGRFRIIDDILCYVEPTAPYRARVAVLEELKSLLLTEVHGGRFSGHFVQNALYGILSKRYWWNGMRKDIRRICRTCLPCLKKDGPGRKLHPKLKPIPVGGPSKSVVVDCVSGIQSHS